MKWCSKRVALYVFFFWYKILKFLMFISRLSDDRVHFSFSLFLLLPLHFGHSESKLSLKLWISINFFFYLDLGMAHPSCIESSKTQQMITEKLLQQLPLY